MPQRWVWLFLCLAGIIVPYWAFVPWVYANGFDLAAFAREAWSTRISQFFVLDVIMSALTLWWAGRRLPRIRLFVLVMVTAVFGVSAALPLYFWFREST